MATINDFKPGDPRPALWNDVSGKEHLADWGPAGPTQFRQARSPEGAMRGLSAKNRADLPQFSLDAAPKFER